MFTIHQKVGQHYENDYLGFPEGYGSQDDFLFRVKQNTQLDKFFPLNDQNPRAYQKVEEKRFAHKRQWIWQ